jgi:FtsP/CotA-like multicopper oxidase with cupredoxin domain
MFAAQIPIAEPAARPTERPSRDFVPWRFSDAGCRSAWLDRRTPASENLHKGGSVVIRSRFLDYTGVFMLHCHMMNHEEMGMMQAVEVYKD